MKRAWPWLGVGAVAVWLVVDLIRRFSANAGFTTDDAYITLRYADNLASGYGVVWNPGEMPPVEGYSNFLYVVVGAAALAVGADPVLVLEVLGVGAVFASAALSWWLARAWMGPLAATAPAIVITSYVGTILWATSGLETSTYQALSLGAVALFVHAFPSTPEQSLSRRRLVASGAVAFLVAITRPEGPLIGLAIGVVLAGRLVLLHDVALRERLRTFAAFTAPFAVPYCIYFAWRLIHFEALLPNSVLCKSLFGEGSRLVIDGYHSLALPYLVLAVLRRPRDVDGRTIVLFLVPLAYALILRDVDPIISYYNRHALTAWAFLVVASVVALSRLATLIPRIPVLAGEVVIVLLAVLWTKPMREDQQRELETFAATYEPRTRDRFAVGGFLFASLGSNDAYVIGDCGIIPYVGHGQAIDVFCLNNRAMSHGAHTPQAVADMVYAASPEAIVVHSSTSDRLQPRGEYGVYPAIVADPRFALYVLVARFGTPGSVFSYWIYRRRY